MARDEIADDLRKQADAARDLIAFLNSDDDALKHDMTEGETGLFEAIDAALAEIDECEIMTTGIKEREKAFADRRQRIEARKERIRGMVEQAIARAGLPTVRAATATLSIRETPPKPVYSEEADIPARFWKAGEPKLDRAAIAEALANGEQVPGVSLSNGGISLQIRRK